MRISDNCQKLKKNKRIMRLCIFEMNNYKIYDNILIL